MKKMIALLLVLVMALSLVACGGNNTPASNNKNNQEQTPGKEKEVTTPNSPDAETETEPEEVSLPEGYAKCVNQGAVILYPTDIYQESIMSGIEKIDGGTPWVRLSIMSTPFKDQKAACEEEHGHSSDYSLTEITVGEHEALKCIYSDMTSYFMEVIIDTSFINDEFWASIAVKVDIPKTNGDLSMFEDETLWEIINSFYFDSSLKYSF